jgi:hypothetical protein
MKHADYIFYIGETNTLWALANHNYTNVDHIKRFTKRPPYYAMSENNITFIVLDTQERLK